MALSETIHNGYVADDSVIQPRVWMEIGYQGISIAILDSSNQLVDQTINPKG